ncbi:50S ribosomal protein L29 [Patescibacteria group bacterium]|nr:50S ribosomal protein L29 [Patescibacteria group bacterium]
MTKRQEQLQQLKAMATSQLKSEEQKIRKGLTNLRIDLNMGRLKDTSKIKKEKKKLARVLTILNEKRREEDNS